MALLSTSVRGVGWAPQNGCCQYLCPQNESQLPPPSPRGCPKSSSGYDPSSFQSNASALYLWVCEILCVPFKSGVSMLVRMAAIKKSINSKYRRGCGEKGTLLHCWWECKLVQTLWRTAWRFLKKLETELPYDPAIPLLGIHIKELNETRVPQCSSQHCLQ